MNEKISTLMQIRNIVKNFFGYKLSIIVPYPEEEKVIARLYDAFEFKFNFINEHYENLFHASLLLPDNVAMDTLLGVDFWKPPTMENIISILETIDRYCRLRLPDKYLEAFDEAYANK